MVYIFMKSPFLFIFYCFVDVYAWNPYSTEKYEYGVSCKMEDVHCSI